MGSNTAVPETFVAFHRNTRRLAVHRSQDWRDGLSFRTLRTCRPGALPAKVSYIWKDLSVSQSGLDRAIRLEEPAQLQADLTIAEAHPWRTAAVAMRARIDSPAVLLIMF